MACWFRQGQARVLPEAAREGSGRVGLNIPASAWVSGLLSTVASDSGLRLLSLPHPLALCHFLLFRPPQPPHPPLQ